MSITRGTLIAAHLAQVDWSKVYTLDTPRYAADYLTAETADRLPWTEFIAAVPALHCCGIAGTSLEAVVVPKSVTWSDRDVNLYVGSPTGQGLRSYLDLDANLFAAVLGWHVTLARDLAIAQGCDVYVTHGFNPLDSAPDAHSVAAKFHTHVHVPDLARRQLAVPSALSHFDRLALIEPYAVVARDLIRRSLARRDAVRWHLAAGFGFVSLYAPLDYRTGGDLKVLAGVLTDVHRAYAVLAGIFSAGHTERATGHLRLVARPRDERRERLAAFEAAAAGWLSDDSAAVLRYLADRLLPAEPRDAPRSTQIATARQLWIAKGLAGAINLLVPADAVMLRFDFAPRVISTSGATKVISTDPTIIRKGQRSATPTDRQRMASFHRAVAAAATRAQPLHVQERCLPSTSSSPVRPASSA